MSHVLGVSEDTGARICHGKYSFDVENNGAVVDGTVLAGKKTRFILLTAKQRCLQLTEICRQLQLISSVKVPVFICQALSMAKLITEHFLTLFLLPQAKAQTKKYLTDNVNTECCYYPEGKQLVVINNADTEQTATVKTDAGDKTVTLSAFDTQIVQL